MTDASGQTSRRMPIWVGPLVIGLLAAAAVAISTRWGLGYSTDSVRYLRVAEWMLGRESGVFSPHFPPGYSAMMAASGWVVDEPRDGIRFVAVALMVLNITLIGSLAGCVAGSSRAWAIAIALSAAIAAPVVNVHIMAWSESPFLLFVFAGIWALARYLDAPSARAGWTWLTGAAVFIGVAALMRWLGASAMLCGGLAILLWSTRAVRWRFVHAAVFSIISLTPIVSWMLYARTVSDSATGRVLGAYLLGFDHLKEFWDTVSGWLLHTSAIIEFAEVPYPEAWSRGAMGLVTVLVIAIWVATRVNRSPATAGDGRAGLLTKLVLLFVGCYMAVLLASISFADPYTPLDDRILSPVFVAMLVLVPALAIRLAVFSREGPAAVVWMRWLLIFLCVVGVIANVMRGRELYRFSFASGLGYNGQRWRESDLIKVVRYLPRYTPVYTNFPDAVYFRTGKTPRVLPFPPVKGLEDEQRFIDRNASVRREIRDSGAVVLLFKGGVRSRLAQREVSPQQARGWWGVAQLPEASIRRFRDGRLMMAQDVASRFRREVLDGLKDFAPTPDNQPPENEPIPEDR